MQEKRFQKNMEEEKRVEDVNHGSGRSKYQKTDMKDKKFQKTVENFVCERCGTFAKGTGYTDHCPKCLRSKHVDINPGDRKSECQGMMEPIGVEVKSREYIIYYQCAKCGYRHRVKSSPEDNFDEIIKLVKQSTN